MSKAVFLDRDGVLNELVYNPNTNEYEPPHFAKDLRLFPFVPDCLIKLQENGYHLFLVSNQPDYAKGKATLGSLKNVEDDFDSILQSHGVYFKEYYYCHHHPGGIVPEFSYECVCHKPRPYFLIKAEEDHDIELDSSWMIGDRDTDVQCGEAAGTKTIIIEEPKSEKQRGLSRPTYKAKNLIDAVKIILK